MHMTTRDSSSGVDSSMDDHSSYFNHHQTLTTTTKRSVSGSAEVDQEEEAAEPEGWEDLSRSFREVQSVLDQNRALIQQVNDNHQSRITDNMVKNVALIQEINGNISKVVSLYSDLSSNFSTFFHHRNDAKDPKPN